MFAINITITPHLCILSQGCPTLVYWTLLSSVWIKTASPHKRALPLFHHVSGVIWLRVFLLAAVLFQDTVMVECHVL